MLTTPFEEMPDTARVWVYGADKPVGPAAEKELLGQVDNYLTTWTAHGTPLSAARDWQEGRFLTITVDQEQAGASGCSIDGLFRTLKSIEKSLGASVVTSGLIFFRDHSGNIRSVTRDEFSELGAAGEIDGDTEVFDLSVTSLAEWRARFSSKAQHSWHASLLPARAR
ncbi:MAG TPA: hypothetical protein VNC11_13240 [Gemmatimonadaceae bacterium]|jgi:hypothetical protein|nr:hypothetical protein [Gemmatimonadaceae bacterium]